VKLDAALAALETAALETAAVETEKAGDAA
jgi:hypothetical protein